MIGKTLLVLCGWLLLVNSISAQISTYQHFDRANGLPSMYITDIAQDERGFLWIATSGGGVAIFDGSQFSRPEANLPIPKYIRNLQAAEGDIWIGGEEGLLKLTRTKIGWHAQASQSLGQINDILLRDTSRLLICGEKGLLEVDQTDLIAQPLSTPTTGPCRCVEGKDAELWFADQDRLHHYDGHTWASYDVADGLPSGPVTDIQVDGGKVWLLTAGSGVSFLEDGRVKPLQPKMGTISRQPTFLGLSDGLLLIGTADMGMQFWDDQEKELTSLPVRDLNGLQTTVFYQDRWSSWWIGTKSSGLYRSIESKTNWLDESDGLSETENIHLAAAPVGVYAVGAHGAIDLLKDGLVSRRVSMSFGMHEVTCWMGDLEQTNYIGTTSGLLQVSDSAIYLTDRHDGALLRTVNALSLTPDSTLLMASDAGLFKIAGTEMERLSSKPFLALLDDGATNWCLSDRSCFRYLADSLRQVFFDRAVANAVRPTCLALSPNGSLHVGTRDHGIFELIDDTLRQAKKYLLDGQVRSLLFAGENQLWVATEGEILRYSSRLNAKTFKRTLIWSRDRRPSFGAFSYRSVAQDMHGNIYFGSGDGILQCRNSHERGQHPDPMLSLDLMSIGDSTIVLKEDVITNVPSGVAISYTPQILDFTPETETYYEWILEGLPNPQWHVSSEATITFYQLQPGFYHFKVRAKNSEGGVSSIESAPLRILAPWWKQWWMPLLWIVVGISLLAAIFQRRSRQQQRRSDREKDQLETQNRILRLEQQALRAQMNPHFIFNVLQTIQSKVALGSKDDARSSIQSFGKLMRMYLDQSRSPSITLEDELKGLELYLALERETRDQRFNYTISVDPAIAMAEDKIPSMLIQPMVENAIKHGQPIDGSLGRIEINVSYLGKNLLCEINDNGPGFRLEDRPRDSRSAGLEVTEARLKSYLKGMTSDPLTIKEREGAGQKGTVVRMIIPIMQ